MHLVLVGHAVTAIYGGLECILGSEIFLKNAEQKALQRPLISMGLASSIKINSADSKCGVTLLIPRQDWNLLEKRKRRLKKDTAELLEFLLKRHQRGNEKLFFANHKKLPVLYQSKGLGLRRCDFEVDSVLWQQFKALARFYNVSMCCLFVDFLRIFGTPSKTSLTLRVQLYEKLQIFSKTALRLYKTTDWEADTS